MGNVVVDHFFNCRYLHPLRRYSRSKSKVVRNCAEFWPFLRSQISGVRPPKLYPNYALASLGHYIARVKLGGEVLAVDAKKKVFFSLLAQTTT